MHESSESLGDPACDVDHGGCYRMQHGAAAGSDEGDPAGEGADPQIGLSRG